MNEKQLMMKLYSRAGCQLCDTVEARILTVIKDLPVQFEVVWITDDPALEEKYMLTIPVVEIDGEEVFLSIDSIVTEMELSEELHRRLPNLQ